MGNQPLLERYRGFFMGPSARSGYLCTAPGLEDQATKERGLQGMCSAKVYWSRARKLEEFYVFLSGGWFSEVPLSSEFTNPNQDWSSARAFYSFIIWKNDLFFVFKASPYLTPQTGAKITKIVLLLIRVHYQVLPLIPAECKRRIFLHCCSYGKSTCTRQIL